MGTLPTWFGEQQPGCGAGKGGRGGLLEREIGWRGERLSVGSGGRWGERTEGLLAEGGWVGEDGEPTPAVRCGSPDRSGGKSAIR